MILTKNYLTTLIFVVLQISLLNSAWTQRDFYNEYEFSAQDSLRGANSSLRQAFDVGYYELDIVVDPSEKSIEGFVTMTFTANKSVESLQLDLFENMQIVAIKNKAGKALDFQREGNTFFVAIEKMEEGAIGSIMIQYKGNPVVAENAPWDGGFVWSNDDNANPWVGVACEGTGASLWWPNKDYLGDEPDSMDIKITVPKTLYANSNGNLIKRKEVGENQAQFHWKVSYPINNYNVTLNIAAYQHFSDVYISQDGDSLALDYYVLPENFEKAKVHFEQVKPMLACYENLFGKYPFWEDGFALVETPYLGMEHQSAIAYGNGYQRGYKGRMIPNDMDWDYIIIHETGHEYFGNSISVADHAEMWIHESFTTYMEALYVECTMGYDSYLKYMVHFRNRLYITNYEPIIGPMGVNFDDWSSSDHYFKGSWMLHTMRNVIDNDELWFELLKEFYQKYKRSVIQSEDFFNFANEKTGRDFQYFFEQYLHHAAVPIFEYRFIEKEEKTYLSYRWNSEVSEFDMPIQVGKKEDYKKIQPTTTWKEITWDGLSEKNFRVRRELYLMRAKELE